MSTERNKKYKNRKCVNTSVSEVVRERLRQSPITIGRCVGYRWMFLLKTRIQKRSRTVQNTHTLLNRNGRKTPAPSKEFSYLWLKNCWETLYDTNGTY